ncbi:calpain 2, (m II) large subunit [Xylographa parallela]|nr:calpain 2, (m II) large subunit [Xylographa parallela]
MAATGQPPKALSSQEIIDKFWATNLAATKAPTTPSSVLPSNVYAQLVGQHMPKGEVGGRSISASYEEAVKDCEAKVAQIVAECKRNNKKYTDPHFDLDDYDGCLNALSATSAASSASASETPDDTINYNVTQQGFSTGGPISWGNIQPSQDQQSSPGAPQPACAKRVGDIFDDPHFYEGAGPQIKDIRQGAEGDCWFISSLGSLCVDTESRHLIERICPKKARNEKVGVYGFVFFRDGEWISEIIDDKLYLGAPDYDDCDDPRRSVWDGAHRRLAPEVSREEYRKTYQSGSNALFFGSCAHPNETWVPLIEKAFAKAHGDFSAVDGGWPGEGVEDLTGGVTTEIDSADILDKDQLWNEGLLRVNKEFLFGAATRGYNHSDPNEEGRQGIEDNHAYSILRAVNYKNNRLLLVKNPWGETEWSGPWSDGSSEWTAEALEDLGHTFGNDGIFWISYADLLRRYNQLWRTRLFTPDWSVSQHWTTIQVPWSGDYNDTKFEFVLSEPGTTVIVLSKLDTRYFQGLTGQYSYSLAFRLHQSGDAVHIVRGFANGERSASAEVDLEAGTYEVLMQISGYRDSTAPKVEDVVKQNWLSRRDKLLSIGLSYDLAHAKGQIPKSDEKGDKKEEVVDVKADKKADKDTSAQAIAQDPAARNVSTSAAPQSTEMPDGASGEAYGVDADPAPAPAPADPAATTPVDSPWDAMCVVGLRVFHQKQAATIRVVRPEPETPAAVTKSKLDIDDPEKDAAEKVDVPGPETKKKAVSMVFRRSRG